GPQTTCSVSPPPCLSVTRRESFSMRVILSFSVSLSVAWNVGGLPASCARAEAGRTSASATAAANSVFMNSLRGLAACGGVRTMHRNAMLDGRTARNFALRRDRRRALVSGRAHASRERAHRQVRDSGVVSIAMRTTITAALAALLLVSTPAHGQVLLGYLFGEKLASPTFNMGFEVGVNFANL